MMDDTWTTTPPYDPDFIYSKATDTKGHAFDLRTRVTEDIDRAVTKLVLNRDTPYQVKADFLRDAVYHRLQYWSERLPHNDTGDVLLRVKVAHSILEQEEAAARFQEMAERLDPIVKQFRRDNAVKHAERLYADLKRELEGITSEYWRTVFINLLDEKFSWLKK